MSNERQPYSTWEDTFDDARKAKDISDSTDIAEGSIPVIKWDNTTAQANDVIVWRHPKQDFPFTTQLLVSHSQVALFENEGQIVPYLPGHETLNESNNTPLKFWQRLRTKRSGGESSFHCNVYFVNMVHLHDLKFGTANPIQMVDPVEGVNIHVRAAGLFGAHIDNDDKDGVGVIKFFTKVVGTRGMYTKQDLAEYLRGKIVERVTDLLGKTIIDKNISALQISAKIAELSSSLQEQMTPFFADYGICIDNFSFTTVNVPDEDLNEVNASKIAAKKMELESISMAKKRALEGYTYQQERGFDVLGTAAGNEATAGQLMGAGMGLGMGFGFGGAMGNVAQNMFGSMNYPPQQGFPQQGFPQQAYPQQGFPQQGGAPQGFVQQQPAQPSAAPQAAMQKCPVCNADVPAGAKFCLNCGQKLAAACPNCGAEIVPGAKFCLSCGTKLN